MNKLLGWLSFNDRLAILLLVGIPVIWLLDAWNGIELKLASEVSGALIATWTMIITYYFRKAPPPGT